MITRMWFISVVLLLAGCAEASLKPEYIQHEGTHAAETLRLCSALETIAPGERRPVTVRGIFVVGPEHQLFYDPSEPTCRLDVQPETWIEFAPNVRSDELDRLTTSRRPLEETRRAYVTFTGELYGPGAVGSDDPSLPPLLAFANRTRNRRYGHLNGYRTKLVVTGVYEATSVPQTAPWPARRLAPSMPVVDAEVPRYPEMAWNVGITGDVVLNVTVSGGQISNVEVRSGDRMLSGEAVRNVKTWRFAPETNATFATTFTFDVEHRLTGASSAPRIELQLPSAVHITAPSNNW